MGKFTKGHIPWNKGIVGCTNSGSFTKGHVVSKKTKDAARKRAIGKKYRLGKKHSKDTKKRMSESRLGKVPWNKGIKITDKNQLKKLRERGIKGLLKQQNSKEPTSIEKKLYEELKIIKIHFDKQKLINKKFLVDAYIPSLNLVIEVDGDYWHSLDRVRKKDKAENAYLKKCGYNLLRIPEKEINDGTYKKILQRRINEIKKEIQNEC